MKKETGGAAFPRDVEERYQDVYGEPHVSEYSEPGMTLRDYFAAKALNAFVANAAIMKTATRADVEQVAEQAYRFADAMLKERKK